MWRSAWVLACAVILCSGQSQAIACSSWADWESFRAHYVSDDGRVIDASTPRQVTVSEGQAYGLFFALVANDRLTFDRLLTWTKDNLSGGDLTKTLPAWLWGHSDAKEWTVLDRNPASDADVWIAYALFEASRLWQAPAYKALASKLSARIVQEEVALVPGLGPTLLPGPKGFVDQQTWRFNASYLPVQLLRGLHHHTRDHVWRDLVASSEKVIVASAPKGFAADWVEYRANTGFITDRSTRGMGSYNAIRVYLWTGMLDDKDPLKRPMARKLAPMVERIAERAMVIEEVDTVTVADRGDGSPGFSAALLPLLAFEKRSAAFARHQSRAKAHIAKSNQSYYSDVLSLFGLGWSEGRYAFDPQGLLKPQWKSSCARAR